MICKLAKSFVFFFHFLSCRKTFCKFCSAWWGDAQRCKLLGGAAAHQTWPINYYSVRTSRVVCELGSSYICKSLFSRWCIFKKSVANLLFYMRWAEFYLMRTRVVVKSAYVLCVVSFVETRKKRRRRRHWWKKIVVFVVNISHLYLFV